MSHTLNAHELMIENSVIHLLDVNDSLTGALFDRDYPLWIDINSDTVRCNEREDVINLRREVRTSIGRLVA